MLPIFAVALGGVYRSGGEENMTKHVATQAQSTLLHAIARVDLRVQDIDRSLAFYRDVVGLEIMAVESHRAELGPQGGPVILVLDSSGVMGPAEPGVTGLFHTAIRFPDRASLADALARLVDAGYRIGAGDHVVSEALYIDDPDGNGVELYRDRPRERWPPPSGDMKVPLVTGPVDLQKLLDESRGPAAVGGQAPLETDIGHVHLQVADIPQTIAFYVENLGLDLMAYLGQQAAFFSSHGYHHNLGANTWHSLGGRPSSKDRAGLDRVIFTTSEKDRLALKNRLASTAYETWDSEDHMVVVDPNGVELRFEAESST